MKLVIVSGFSGSGKSTALNVLEDAGYYCIDNLPLALLADFVRQALEARSPIAEAAVGIDARNMTSDLETFPEILQTIRGLGVACHTLFLDASNSILLKRFSENKRKHPLSNSKTSLSEAIFLEQKLLEPLQREADLFIDTSDTNIHELRERIRNQVINQTEAGMSLMFQSFGYKHGVPADVDYVFDVRCLPNPHWEPALRPKTGKDAEVVAFLEKNPLVGEMADDITSFIQKWVQVFIKENRSYMSVAIGCTGGQHRSVYMVERLARCFSEQYPNVIARHRELT